VASSANRRATYSGIFTQQLLLDWKYNFKHFNFRKQTTMFVREKHLWKKNSVVDPAFGFLVRAFVVRVIGHTWKTDHIVPWQVLINLIQSTYYLTIFGGQKRLHNLMASSVKIRWRNLFSSRHRMAHRGVMVLFPFCQSHMEITWKVWDYLLSYRSCFRSVSASWLKIIFEMCLSENSPETGTSCDARALTYLEVVQGISSTYYIITY